ncbi:Sortilin [Fasciola gigantica]|uniref:Sortilin n=1 Tax=Fasciola gigantica TaxID=46835 RepID=A0A504YL39_FASGI|nr:Sortilin [Fasciola gigantica]
MSSNRLIKTVDFGKSWISIIDNVVRVWAPRGIQSKPVGPGWSQGTELSAAVDVEQTKRGRFLYVAHNTDVDNQTVHLSISTDGGKTFQPVYLPTIVPERFYSVLEVEDDLAFVHVDAPNDTGYGTLFTSDATGRVFTESLRQHLYPNHAPVTDFYRVASMRGTYLATRLNPDRTLHTVITHDRGASWRALGAPLNTPGACKSSSPNREGGVQSSSTPASWTTFSRAQISGANHSGENGNHESRVTAVHNSIQSISNETWESEQGTNDSLSVDPSAIKVCGLQVSNQFSIRNRVIASPPLSISAAPGLILVHGHVATHLKNTPADVFVSSDGGYTWLKALDGPHHYQIANRGGLIVAVPANTLWPDVLRFSTDEGRCWHTIPLRTGTWHTDSTTQTTQTPTRTTFTPRPENHVTTVVVSVHGSYTTPVAAALLNATNQTAGDRTVSAVLLNSVNPNTGNVNATTPLVNASRVAGAHANRTEETISGNPSVVDSWNRARADETVVFTGLVTEPGGRAMAAAVYGYGTVSQRWRVAVVDFITNGMVQRNCNANDYEEWVPHSSEEVANDGCLLGLRERYRRLKKDSVCVNEYGMNPLLKTEICPCTPADFECEYGFYRQLGSLDCIRNPHIPFLDPCLLPESERDRTFELGYRRIPGDQCTGGWQPPHWTQTVMHRASRCMVRDQSLDNSPGHIFTPTIAILLLSICIIAVGIAFYCHRRSRQFYGTYPVTYPRSRFGTMTDNVRRAVNPWSWKRSAHGGFGTAHAYSDSSSVLWPPTNPNSAWPVMQSELRGSYHQENHHPHNHPYHHRPSLGSSNLNSVPGIAPVSVGPSSGANGVANPLNLHITPKSSSGLDTLTHLTHMRPTFMSRLRANGSDVTNLLDAEELAIPSDMHGSTGQQPDVVFRDPLGGST